MPQISYVTTPPPRHSGPITLSVIAPCFNEEGNIDTLADRALAVFDGMGTIAELILVDDGSKDATWDLIAKRASLDERVRGIKHERNGGIETAWKSGVEASEGHLVCLIDADLQNRPEDIAALYKTYLREVPDMVQAVRHATGPARKRQVFSRGLNLMLNLAFGMKLRDNKSGFVLGRRDVFSNILRHHYNYRYYQSFIGVAAGARGYLIAETDTVFDAREAGKSFLPRFPIAVSAQIVWELVKYRYETWSWSGRGAIAHPKSVARSVGFHAATRGEAS